MNFFGIGPMELILVLVIALIVFGPGKLPEIANTLGKSIRRLRMATTELTRDFSKEIVEETKGTGKEVNANPDVTAEKEDKEEEI